MHQQVAAEHAPEMAQVLDAKRWSMKQITEEEQAHRAQVTALSKMEWMDAQEKELWRLSALLVEHQAFLKSSPERPYQETMKAPAEIF